MGIAFDYDEEQRLAIAVWVGDVTAEDWRAQTVQRLADPAMVAAQRVLGDIRRWKADESIVQDVINEIAELWGTSGVVAGKPVAIVAGEGFWDARMFERAMAKYGLTVIVLNDVDTACTWLRVDPVTTGQRLTQMADVLREAGE